MESQMVHPRGHNQEQDLYKAGDPHLVKEGEDEHHPEKKSVLNRVKAKAKKIKDTITKHGHGHNHDHDHECHYHDGDHVLDDHDLDEEDDEDEEIVEDPETHGAPIYESAAVKGTVTPVNTPLSSFSDHGISETKETDPIETSVLGTESRVDLESERPVNKPPSSFSHGISETKETTAIKEFVPGTESRVGLDREKPENKPLPSFSYGVYETKETEPSRTFPGTESRVNLGGPVNTPLPSSFDHGISETKETDSSKTSVPGAEYGVNLDRTENTTLSSFSSGVSDIRESNPTKNFATETESRVNLDKPLNTPLYSLSDHGISDIKESDPSKTFVPGTESKVNLERPEGLEEDPHSPKDISHKYTPSNYQTKVTDPTGAGAEEAGITPILRSFDKMNIHEGSEPKQQETQTNIGSSTGSHDQFSPKPFSHNPITTPQHPQTTEESFNTIKPETHPHESATEKSSAPISYTQKISSATSVLADKAISAKNVVTSKLGYGEKNDRGAHETTEDSTTTKPSSASASAAEYGKKIAATVTEKLSPVYEKVAGAGSTVMSKVPGSAGSSVNESPPNITGSGANGTKGQDRGVSVKDYFAEKLRPGDEDKALSEVISDALHKRKQKPEKESESRPMGKVTESEEVKRSLGSGDEKTEEKEQSSYVNRSPGEQISVVDKLKGSFGTWFGLGGVQSQTSQESQGEIGENIHGKEERRLQESGN